MTSTSQTRPVMADVARAAGVSIKTVSRVINEEPNVRPQVAKRVEAAIEELGYRRNSAARALVQRRSQVIGVVTLSSALYGPASQLFGVEHAAAEFGYSVVVSSLRDAQPAELARAVGQLVEHDVAGIVLATQTRTMTVDLPKILQGVPAVALDHFGQDSPLPAVLPDQRRGARMVTESLLRLGHETVWHVAGPPEWNASAERLAGWREALESAGAEVPPPIEGDWSPERGHVIGQDLAARPEITAVFAANDHMAMGVMRAFFEVGKHIPGDVSVVGFDDVPEAAHLLIPLTTVRQDFGAATRQGVQRLVELLRGRDPQPEVVYVPVALKQRASSGPPPGRHPG